MWKWFGLRTLVRDGSMLLSGLCLVKALCKAGIVLIQPALEQTFACVVRTRSRTCFFYTRTFGRQQCKEKPREKSGNGSRLKLNDNSGNRPLHLWLRSVNVNGQDNEKRGQQWLVVRKKRKHSPTGSRSTSQHGWRVFCSICFPHVGAACIGSLYVRKDVYACLSRSIITAPTCWHRSLAGD